MELTCMKLSLWSALRSLLVKSSKSLEKKRGRAHKKAAESVMPETFIVVRSSRSLGEKYQKPLKEEGPRAQGGSFIVACMKLSLGSTLRSLLVKSTTSS